MLRGLRRRVGLLYFGSKGITVNVVQPGPVDADMKPADGPHADVVKATMVTKRHGRPEEVAGMVAWLAGVEAVFLIGAIRTIDGSFAA